MHWRDLDASNFVYRRGGTPFALSVTPYPGLHLTVDSAPRPTLRFEFAGHLLFRLVAGTSTLLWGRIDDWWTGAELLRDEPLPWPIVPPLRARDIDALTVTPGTAPWYAHWSRAFARELAASRLTPLHVGKWLLLPRTEPTTPDAPWPPRCSLDVPKSAWPPDGDEFDQDATHRPIWLNYSEGSPAPLLRLRPLHDAADSRVKMWRKRARERSLPPLLALFVSPIATYVLLDGHDRLAAARAEGVSPPLIALTPVQERAHVPDPDLQHSLVDAVVEMEKHHVPPDVLNRVLTTAFDDRPRPVPLTRVWPLAGGVAAWRDAVLRAAQRTRADVRESLVFGL